MNVGVINKVDSQLILDTNLKILKTCIMKNNMKQLSKSDLLEINGGVDPEVSVHITTKDVIDAFHAVRNTIRSWGHTIGCLIWGGN